MAKALKIVIMDIDQTLSVNRISCKQDVSSKKRALELMCNLLAADQALLDENQIFSCMLERERLGSTGVGHGVAIPHSRMDGVEQAIVALITLDTPIEYDSPDDEPVDILFALLVPLDCTSEHLDILAKAAHMFSDESLCERIRASETPQDIYDLLVKFEQAAA